MRMKRIFIKPRFITWLVLIAALILVQSVVVAAYIGPNRTHTVITYLRVCYDIHTTPLWTETCRCNPGSSGARCGEVGGADYGCWPGENGNDSCDEETGSHDVTDPSATVSGTPTCALNGNSGWCRGLVTVNFSANEPVAGKVITFIEGTPGTLCDPADAASVNCSRVDSTQGPVSYNFWAHTTYGDTSAMGTASYSIDTVNPSLNMGVPVSTGMNGWYIAPVNLTVSGTDATSGLSAAQIQVDGGAWTNNSTTIFADGTHTATFRTTDVAGNTSSNSTTIKVDQTKPVLSLNKAGTAGLAGWYVSNVTVSPNASDATSSIAFAQSRVDGGAWGASQTIAVDGTHSADGQAADVAGNTNNASDTIKVDKTLPTITGTIPAADGLNGWHVSPAALSASGTDATSGLWDVAIALDGGAWLGSPYTVATEGNHSVIFRSRDNAGNTNTTSSTFKLDLVAPVITPSSACTFGLNGWCIAPATLSAAGTDAVSGIDASSAACNYDGLGWNPSPITLGTDGNHNAICRISDLAGHSTTSPNMNIKVDQTDPTLSYNIPAPDGANGWRVSATTVTASGTDATSGLWDAAIRLDGGAWQLNSAPVTTEGNHSVDLRTRDNAGNENTATGAVKIDLTDPTSAITRTGTTGVNGWYVSTVTANPTGTDAVSGVDKLEIQADAGAWQPSLTLTDGVYNLAARTTDLAGHTATSPMLETKVDANPPVLAMIANGTQGDNGWWVSPLTIFSQASDATSGLKTVEGKLNTGAWTTGTSVVVADNGESTVQFRAEDVAGHTTTVGQSYKVDAVKPLVSITSPAANDVLSGIVTVTGTAGDVHSGLRMAEISLNGSTWEGMLVSAGAWTYTWDTRTRGSNTIMVRTTDVAGNINVASVPVIVANAGPSITLTELWYIWQTGDLVVRAGDSDLARVTVVISDVQNRWPAVTLTYSGDLIPEVVKWDRKFANGIVAPPGRYLASAEAVDVNGKSASAVGWIVIPQPAQPTVTPTAIVLPTTTATAQPTATAIATGTPEPTRTENSRPTATIVAPPFTPEPTEPRLPPKPINFGPHLVLISLCLMLGASITDDRRPREWRRINEQVAKIIDLYQKEK